MNTLPIDQITKIWPLPSDTYTLEQLTSGHINTTWKLSGQTHAYVLQRLHSIFDPRVCLDANAVVSVVSEHVELPHYLPTTANKLWHIDEHGAIWRLMTHLPYATLNTLKSIEQAYSAGHLVGAYHAAVKNQHIELQAPDLHLHDPLQREQQLHDAIRVHKDHLFHTRVTALTERLGPARAIKQMPHRLCHGDLKLTNILWDHDQAKAIIDLDTFAYMPLAYELGDAFRSWCNPSNETAEGSRFNTNLFLAGMNGFADGTQGAFDTQELHSVLDGIEIITKELCMRFLADTLNESYFGWDQEHYASAADHNWDRAQSQWKLLESFLAQKEMLYEELQARSKQI